MRVRATADQQPWNKFEKVFNQAVPTLHGPGLAFPAGVNVQHGKWLAVVVFAVLPRTAESVSEAQGPRLIGKSKCLPRAKVITDDLMLPASRQVADVVEERSPKPVKCAVFICAALLGPRGDCEKACAVVVGEFKDEVEIRAAEQGGEFQVCN